MSCIGFPYIVFGNGINLPSQATLFMKVRPSSSVPDENFGWST